MGAFQYEALPIDPVEPRIRVLDLQAGTGQIKCQVRTEVLSDDLQFEALSYTWGSAKTRSRIKLNGSDFMITKDLNAALKRFRYKDKPRTLWVDAICINQQDAAEKSVQVALMADIYRHCQRVLIWLGKQSLLTKRAYNFVEVLAALESDEEFLARDAEFRQFARPLDWIAIYALFDDRPWFRRAWVIQEVSVCRKAVMTCGPHEIDWEVVRKAQLNSSTAFSSGLQRLSIQRSEWQQQKVSDLLSVLVRHLEAEASDPRDRLFAILGLQSQSLQYDVKVDYSAPVEDIFEAFTRTCLMRRKDLNILAVARGCRDDAPDHVPSWCFYWQINVYFEPGILTSFSWSSVFWVEKRAFDATLASVCEPSFSSDGSTLTLSGYVTDTIVVTGIPSGKPLEKAASLTWTYLSGVVDAVICYLNWRSLCRLDGNEEEQHYTPTGSSMAEAFWRTCCATNNLLASDSTHVGEYWRQWDDWLSSFRWMERNMQNDAYAAPKSVYVTLLVAKLVKEIAVFPFAPNHRDALRFPGLVDAVAGRTFFKTANGYIGLGPKWTAKGDSITLLNGSRAPIIARQRHQKSIRWKVVGEAYVHGIMHGEAWDPGKCEDMFFE